MLRRLNIYIGSCLSRRTALHIYLPSARRTFISHKKANSGQVLVQTAKFACLLANIRLNHSIHMNTQTLCVCVCVLRVYVRAYVYVSGCTGWRQI